MASIREDLPIVIMKALIMSYFTSDYIWMYANCVSITFTGVVFSSIIQFKSQTGGVISLYNINKRL